MVNMEDDFVAEGLVIFTSVLDELVVSWVVEVGSTVAVGDAFFCRLHWSSCGGRPIFRRCIVNCSLCRCCGNIYKIVKLNELVCFIR